MNRSNEEYDPWGLDQRDFELNNVLLSQVNDVDEETWLTGVDDIQKYRKAAPPTRSASMGILNETLFHPYNDDAPFHSTPTKKKVDLNKTFSGEKVKQDLNRTMDKESLSAAFGRISPVKTENGNGTSHNNAPEESALNRTFDKEEPVTVAPDSKNRILPKKSAGPPVTKLRITRPAQPGLPQVNSSPSLNRTSSLGSLNPPKAQSVIAPLRARPPSAVNSKNNGAGDAVKTAKPAPVPVASRLPAPSKIPAPSGIPTRIPRPGVVPKK